jgi:hypothetical protein
MRFMQSTIKWIPIAVSMRLKRPQNEADDLLSNAEVKSYGVMHALFHIS